MVFVNYSLYLKTEYVIVILSQQFSRGQCEIKLKCQLWYYVVYYHNTCTLNLNLFLYDTTFNYWNTIIDH